MSKEKHDVVVVGAGIGGLSAGGLLAARGLDVLVLERREVPGGCCSALRVDGYAFDVAASLFYGFGETGFNANRRVLDELGVDLELVPQDPSFAVVFEGTKLEVHADLEEHLAALAKAFPSCAAGLRSFYEKVKPVYDDAARVGFLPVADASLRELAALAFGNPSLVVSYLPKMSKTVWDLLGPALSGGDEDEVRRLKSLFDVDLAFGTCADAETAPLLLAVPILLDRHLGGVVYPIGGADAVAAAFAEGLRRKGGELRLGTAVRRITTERRQVTGVELDGGEAIAADRVISDVGVWSTFDRLLEPSVVSGARRRALARLEPSFSVFVTCVGVDAEIVPEGFHPHTVVVPDHRVGLRDVSIIYCPSLVDPSLAPAGKHAVTIINVTDYGRWVAEGDAVAREVVGLDASMRLRALQLADQVLPGIAERGDVKGTLSPATLESRLGRRFGAVGGPAQTVRQSLQNRQGNRGELEGLYLVGDSTFPGEGVVAVTISGLNCAGQIQPRATEVAPVGAGEGRLREGAERQAREG